MLNKRGMGLRGKVAGWIFSILVLPAIFGFAGNCFGSVTVVYESDRITVRASDQPLGKILEKLSTVLDVDIYMAEECGNERITIALESVPVETALGRILRPVSYVALYRDGPSGSRISALKVYPRGKQGDSLALVKRDEAPVAEISPGAVEPPVLEGSADSEGLPGSRVPAPGAAGVLVPQYIEPSGTVSVASVKAMQAFELERALHEEILELEFKAASAGDEETRAALLAGVREKIEEFHRLQKSNRNAQAALRRMELFHAEKAGSAGQ